MVMLNNQMAKQPSLCAILMFCLVLIAFVRVDIDIFTVQSLHELDPSIEKPPFIDSLIWHDAMKPAGVWAVQVKDGVQTGGYQPRLVDTTSIG